ncbi:MAG: glycoside hydrolase family 2 TIM barrel-domain containing protein [Bacteroidales bacterium]
MKKQMNKMITAAVLILVMSACGTKKGGTSSLFSDLEGPRSAILFDFDWKFYRGDIEGARVLTFNDDTWRNIDLPHDWSIEDIPGTNSPLDSGAVGGIDMGYYTGGTGWYRKIFTIPSALKNKRFSMMFEGIYMDSEIWINGEPVGKHPYGYTSFQFDITDKLIFGKENVVAVKVQNEGRNSRWYSGSGIYRHVWLTLTDPIHITPWGTAITTPNLKDDYADVHVTNEIENNTGEYASVKVSTTIYDDEGNEIASDMKTAEAIPGSKIIVLQEMEIRNPDLWSVESPILYSAVTEIIDKNLVVTDVVETSFGVRQIEFTSEGFFLNGVNVLLKGGCMHHDNGPLGAAAYDRAEERRVALMKANGFNSIRTAHNPPSPAFLDACDRLGMLVIDEAFDMWRRPKNPQDYHRFFNDWWGLDIESMVLRDRNHPSVIMWSTGNEIPERGDQEGVETSKMLTEFIHRLDPTRPVTSAVNGLNADKDPYFATFDIAGYNYSFGGDHGRESIFKTDHQRVPDRIMYCSESYPLTAFGAWMDVLDHPYVIGDFVWTGFDYLGEASIGWLGYPHEGSFYPWNHAFCGDIDICGWKRPQSFYRDVLWNTGEKLSIFVQPPEPSFEENPDRKDWSKWHWQDVTDRWNWEGYENEPLNVEVYCAYERVELFINGKSLGIRETNRGTEWIARWEVPYAPGTLKAVAYNGSVEADSYELYTAGNPVSVKLNPDRTTIQANNQDLSYIVVELIDSEGRRNKVAEDLVEFQIEGPGSIIAVSSSNPMSSESYQRPRRKAYMGRCLVIVKSTEQPGVISLKASAGQLKPAEVFITTN